MNNFVESMSEIENESWAAWSRHVLKELERLNTNIETISKELGEVKEELATLKNQQISVGELKQWKKEIEAEISPVILRELKEEVKNLNTFKTISTTIWIVVQVIFGLIVAFKDKLFP